MKLDSYPIPYAKINSKWIKDLDKCNAPNHGSSRRKQKIILNTGIGNYFLHMIQKAKAIAAKINK